MVRFSKVAKTLYPATLTRGLFLCSPHYSSHRRKVNPKVLPDLLVTVGSRLVRRPHRLFTIPVPSLDVLERWRRSLTLRPRDIDVFDPSTLQLPLHPLDEAIGRSIVMHVQSCLVGPAFQQRKLSSVTF